MKRLSKNRKWLEKKCLPKLKGLTLFVGVEKYTKDYHKLVRGTMETIDLNRKLARYGSPHGHYKKNFVKFKAKRKYDNVVMFGLFGQGHSWTNNKNRIFRAHEHALRMLKARGNLISGHRAGVKISAKKWFYLFAVLGSDHNLKTKYIGLLDRQAVVWMKK